MKLIVLSMLVFLLSGCAQNQVSNSSSASQQALNSSDSAMTMYVFPSQQNGLKSAGYFLEFDSAADSSAAYKYRD